MKRTSIYVSLFIAILVGVASVGFSKVSEVHEEITQNTSNYRIVDTWKLPEELKEVSGITWVDNNTLACIQDEDGIIYIYNLKERKVTNEISFAKNGDYEGIAVNKEDLYVMRSDGLLYEIKDWNKNNKVISAHETGFKASNNMESLVYSKKEDVLLTIPKNKDETEDFKGIYRISLATKNADKTNPAQKISMTDDALKNYRSKKLHKTLNPSEIAVHPITHDIYVLEGSNPKLLILNPKGVIKHVFKLDKTDFPQPEGMTFSENGDLYISNEASSKGTATIHLVVL